MNILIKNGRVIDPESGLDEVTDILIEDGKIKEINAECGMRNAEFRTIDVSGKVVVPGLIDLHTHLREPGREDEETIATGTRAAAKGGFTTICCMPNTQPVIDNPSVVRFILEKAGREGLVNVLPVGSISKNLGGKELSEIGQMVEEGAVAISDDGQGLANSDLMRRALEHVKRFGIPVISHCEDSYLSKDGVMNEGYISTVLGLPGIPGAAEEIMVARDIILAQLTNSRLHIAHLSTVRSVELVRQAKKQDVKVTAEAAPHHFTLTEEAVRNFDTNTKVNPPLRTFEDVEGIKKGLADGTIDCIATDHAPHTQAEKELEYGLAPFGMIGLETALSLVLTELVSKGVLSLPEAIAKLTINPAKVLGLNQGRIKEGAAADMTVIDLEKEWTVKEDEFLSKSKNSPFIGLQLKGKAVMTIVGGKVVMEDEKISHREHREG
ncbi:dihydroorotase [bacterium]|nr:dihydroorotase [bacterium]MBU1614396.1 dihydroorotase [bacterium]